MEHFTNSNFDREPYRDSGTRSGIETGRVSECFTATDSGAARRDHKAAGARAVPLELPSCEITMGTARERGAEYQVKEGDSLWRIARELTKRNDGGNSRHSVPEMVHLLIEANKERYPQLQENPRLIDCSMRLLVPRLHEGSSSGHDKPAHGKPAHDKPAHEALPPEHHGLIPHHQQSAEKTVASWYGFQFNGRKTSSGEIFDINKMTAAHKTLPFGTLVEVTNPANGSHVIVKINDRGPFVAGRGLDLSPVAARKLGTYNSGIAHVEYRVVDERNCTSI